MDLKSYKTLGPGANVITDFLSVIYIFSYLARMFVRLGWRSLTKTNTLAYYENPLFMGKEVL